MFEAVGFSCVLNVSTRSANSVCAVVIASHRAVKTARDADHTDISYSNSIQEQKRSFKYLGVIGEESLSWNSHIMLFQVKIF